METKFQTSFIPKKSLIPTTPQKTPRVSGVSIFMALAVIVFVASLAGAGFTYVWKGFLISSQEKYKKDLAANEENFRIDEIERLKKKNLKIDFTKGLLKDHLSVSQIFNIIGGLTIDGVRFTSLDYTGPDSKSTTDKMAHISMKGLANSYSSIAWQSDVFGRSDRYGTNKILKNPILSDLSVDANGNVGFTFTTNIDPKDISYEETLKALFPPETVNSEDSSSTPQNNQ